MKSIAIVSLLLVLGACGASINGSANSNAGDKCKGHFDCGAAGCCWEANQDGEGFSCNDPGDRRGPCSYVGLTPDGNGEFRAPKPVDPPKSSTSPDEPPPVRHDGQG